MTEKKKTGFFRGIRNEFKKITWPTKNEIFKSTVVVVAALIGMSILVKLLDTIFRFILSFTV
ncbi:preprotein translocase subunit SecE [uncultured Helcococcus sp.]|uniref:preprotein translocase subunit SecE n=1 Tax=uncultured Helcococcus sp. TaxID=1072508 RepID=UPI00262D1783|nr:preprotein translocase subunit SecE [uncultured Helcococcus sp.]